MKKIKNYILKLKKYFIAFMVSFLLITFIKLIFVNNFYLSIALFIAFYFLTLFLLKKGLNFTKKEIIFSFIISLFFSLALFPLYSVPKQNFSIEYEKAGQNDKFYGNKDVAQSLKICDVKSGPFSINMEKTFGRQCIYLTENNKKMSFTVIPNLPLNITYESKSQGANAVLHINDKEIKDNINSKITRVVYKEYEGINSSYPFYKSILKFVIFVLSLTTISLIFIKLIKINKNFIYSGAVLNVILLSKLLNLTNNYCILLIALFLFISFLLVKFSTTSFIRKYYSKLNLITFLIIAFAITFMCVGYETFMATNKAFYFDYYSVMYFVIIMLYVSVVMFTLLLLFDNIKLNFKKNKNRFNKGTIVFLISFLTLSISWIVYSTIYYPGLMSVDSIYSWMQASGYKAFDNFHPTFYSFFLYLFASIFKNPFSVIIFQNIASALIISLILREFYLKGINKKIIALILLIFVLVPNVSMMQATMWKDVPFTISLLCVTYLIYKLSLNENNETKNICFLIIFSIFLVFLLQFRYNGIIAVGLIFIYLIITSIKKRNLLLSGVVVLTILLNFIVVLCIDGIFNTKEVNVSGVKYTSIIKNFAATLYYDKVLDEEAVDKLDALFDKEQFIENYESTNIDTLYNMEGNTIDYWLPEINNYSFLEIVPLYVKNIFSNPDVFFRDKLNGMNIMFNLNPKYYEPIYAFHIGYPDGTIQEQEVIEEQINSSLDKAINVTAVAETNKLLNDSLFSDFQNLVWRASLWVALLLVAFLYFFISKSKRSLIVFLPLLGYTLSWFIALNHQSFRYVYYINYIAIFAILLALILKERKNDN